MKRSSVFTPTRIAGLFGAVFAFVFLTLNDPDAMPPTALGASKWFVLLPAAFLFAVWPAVKPWVSGLAIAGGIFAGTCAAAIAHSSNVWPIAGVYWTVVWTPPIVMGSVAGALIGWGMRRVATR